MNKGSGSLHVPDRLAGKHSGPMAKPSLQACIKTCVEELSHCKTIRAHEWRSLSAQTMAKREESKNNNERREYLDLPPLSDVHGRTTTMSYIDDRGTHDMVGYTTSTTMRGKVIFC